MTQVSVFQNIKVLDKEIVEKMAQRIRENQDPLMFIVFKYKDGTKDTIELAQSGNDSWESFEANFKDDQICWVMWRINYASSTKPKFVFISWIGEKLKTVARVSVIPHTQSMKELLGFFHVTFYGRNKEELNPETVQERITKSAGVRFDQSENFEQQKSIIDDNFKK